MGNGRPCGNWQPHGTDVQVDRTVVFHDLGTIVFDAPTGAVNWPASAGLRALKSKLARPKTREIIGTCEFKYKPTAPFQRGNNAPTNMRRTP